MNRKFNGALLSLSAAQNIEAGMVSMKDQVMNLVVRIGNVVIIPLISLGIGCFLIAQIASCVKRHRNQETWSDKLVPMIITIIALLVVATFPTWGWSMLGVTQSA